jgi:hypothetical protein
MSAVGTLLSYLFSQSSLNFYKCKFAMVLIHSNKEFYFEANNATKKKEGVNPNRLTPSFLFMVVMKKTLY